MSLMPVIKRCLVVVILTGSIREVEAMPVFNKRILFSDVKGVVLDNGTPVAGVVVERKVKEAGKEKVDTVITDNSGRFNFNRIEKTAHSIFGFLPHETVITQRISINIADQKYKAWVCIKRNYDNNGELQGMPIDLICDIRNQFIKVEGELKGICRLR
jgi:hypothetical protein